MTNEMSASRLKGLPGGNYDQADGIARSLDS